MKRIVLLFPLLGLLLLFSCEKESINVTKDQTPIKGRSSEVHLTFDQLKFIGSKHNEYLTYVVNNLNLTNETLDDDLALYTELNTHSDFASYTFSELSFERDFNTLENTLRSTLSSTGDSLLNVALNMCMSIEDVGVFQTSIQDLINDSKDILSISEYNILATTFIVFSYSAEFWAPVEKGGTGLGYQALISNRGEDNVMRAFNWRSAMVSDGISGGVGMIGVAVVGALGGPVGWIALAAVAGEAAANSGIFGFLG